MSADRKLISLHVSPWSERAKWALDHHRLTFEVVEHMPILGERRLRKLVGPGKPRATVPVLVTGAEPITDSWDIALYADREGTGAKLIEKVHEAAIKGWVDLADQAMSAGRVLVLAGLLENGRALDAQNPRFVPRWLRPALRPMARSLTRAFVRKYDLPLADLEGQKRICRGALDRLRSGLAASGPYLEGTFSYADIAMATLLQGISPVDNRFIKLGRDLRAVWTQPDLASEYADLVAWRDRLYETHRRSH
jgi:glutathione S-transferase